MNTETKRAVRRAATVLTIAAAALAHAGAQDEKFAERQVLDPDRIHSLMDLKPKHMLDVIAFIRDGAVPYRFRTRNAAMALAQDSRFAALRRTLEAELTGAITDDQRAAALERAFERTMPSTVGSHVDILEDGASDNDLVDRLVRELR